MRPFLFVALDGLTRKEKETLEIANKLSNVNNENFGFKINLDYLLNKGLENAINPIKKLGRPIFADLKMWNGGRTMSSVIENLFILEVDYMNVYALADDLLPEAIKITTKAKTKVLGLTVLTHFDDAYCQKHFKRSLSETVRHFAEVAIDVGCHGIILPGTVLDAVSDITGIIKVVPGVRPVWYGDKRHKEEIEPWLAVKKGADILVCGSPIMKSVNPVEALERILSQMR